MQMDKVSAEHRERQEASLSSQRAELELEHRQQLATAEAALVKAQKETSDAQAKVTQAEAVVESQPRELEVHHESRQEASLGSQRAELELEHRQQLRELEAKHKQQLVDTQHMVMNLAKQASAAGAASETRAAEIKYKTRLEAELKGLRETLELEHRQNLKMAIESKALEVKVELARANEANIRVAEENVGRAQALREETNQLLVIERTKVVQYQSLVAELEAAHDEAVAAHDEVSMLAGRAAADSATETEKLEGAKRNETGAAEAANDAMREELERMRQDVTELHEKLSAAESIALSSRAARDGLEIHHSAALEAAQLAHQATLKESLTDQQKVLGNQHKSRLASLEAAHGEAAARANRLAAELSVSKQQAENAESRLEQEDLEASLAKEAKLQVRLQRRGPALRCVLVCAHETFTIHSQKAGPFSVARLKMGLPFHNRLAYYRVHGRSASASPLTAPCQHAYRTHVPLTTLLNRAAYCSAILALVAHTECRTPPGAPPTDRGRGGRCGAAFD